MTNRQSAMNPRRTAGVDSRARRDQHDPQQVPGDEEDRDEGGEGCPPRRPAPGDGTTRQGVPARRPAAPGSARRAASAPGPRPARGRIVTPCGSFSRHFRQIVSRSRSTRRLIAAGGSGGSGSRTCSSVSSDRVAPERRPAGQQRVEDRAEAVDVGRRGDRPRVAGRPARGPCTAGVPRIGPGRVRSAVRLDPLGQPEVGDVRLPLARRAGCSRASGRGGGCRAGGRGGPPGRPRPISRAAAPGVAAVNSASRVGQAPALDQLHAEVALPLVLADLVDRARCSGGRGRRPPRPRCGTAATSSAGGEPRRRGSSSGRRRG